MILSKCAEVEQVNLRIVIMLRIAIWPRAHTIRNRRIAHFPIDKQPPGNDAVRYSFWVPAMQEHICQHVAGKLVNRGRIRGNSGRRILYRPGCGSAHSTTTKPGTPPPEAGLQPAATHNDRIRLNGEA